MDLKKTPASFENNNRIHFVFIFILFFVGIFVRSSSISVVPGGLNQDEASIGYEAFSIMTTGKDRSGNSYPVHFVSWGSGQNALYAYLSIPFIRIFGLNAFSIRIVNTIFSCISLIVFYLLFKLILNKKKAILALAILAICPWSIMAGRWGLEANIFPVLFLIAVYFLFKGIYSAPGYYFLSFAIFAICLYAYGTSYLIIPLFFIAVLPYLLIKKLLSPKQLFFCLLIFFTIATPILLFILINHFGLNEIHWGKITIPKLDSNRTTVVFNLFSGNIAITLLKNALRLIYILILQTDNNIYNALPSSGTVYHVSLPFFFLGLLGIFKNKSFIHKPFHYISFFWLISSFALGIFTHVNINRINIIFFPILYFTVLGILDAGNLIKTKYKKQFYPFIIGIYMLFFGVFTGNYFLLAQKQIKHNFAFGLEEAVKYAEKNYSQAPVYVSTNTVNMPYIYICFYTQMNANTFREKVVYGENKSGFREVLSLERYNFGNELFRNNAINIIRENESPNIDIKNSKILKFGNFYLCDLYNK
ncbi:MAG: glycosyltransferase family 39 protein [Paludibacter sp.]|nr:glycosyltransferase family 39 protein [Paludibacter sp.]MDD4197944.1 glycosyltransferase family 39 protein [Paludibacter sp.]MDD4427241.1 glycosyltransferase family 39 protein [Paludibacter sp.]